MVSPCFALFESAIGCCGIVWTDQKIVGTQLPELDADAAARLLHRRFSGATESLPPEPVQMAIDAIRALLEGGPTAATEIELDLDPLPEFSRRVYRATRAIPFGRTATYGEIAGQIGSAGEARAVGQALGRNPFPILVPCHRVLAAGGRAGGFSANGGVATKMKILTIERATTTAEPTLFDGADWPLVTRR